MMLKKEEILENARKGEVTSDKKLFGS